MAAPVYDAIIIGGGPGGLSAAIVGALRGMKILVLEGGSFGGLLASLYPNKIVMNYPGLSGEVTAGEIAKNIVLQARALDIEMRNERALSVSKEKVVRTEEGEYTGKAIIIATGSRPREVGILGEMEYNLPGRGVYYYVDNIERFKGRSVLIAGGGDTAIDSTLALAGVASKVTLVHRRSEFRALEVNVKKVLTSHEIEVKTRTRIEEIKGNEVVTSVKLVDDEGRETELGVDAVVLAFGAVPNNEIFEGLGLEMDVDGKIMTDPRQKTNIPGFYAVGDIVSGTGSLELIIVAAAQGAVAAHHAYLETAEPYWG